MSKRDKWWDKWWGKWGVVISWVLMIILIGKLLSERDISINWDKVETVAGIVFQLLLHFGGSLLLIIFGAYLFYLVISALNKYLDK